MSKYYAHCFVGENPRYTMTGSNKQELISDIRFHCEYTRKDNETCKWFVFDADDLCIAAGSIDENGKRHKLDTREAQWI